MCSSVFCPPFLWHHLDDVHLGRIHVPRLYTLHIIDCCTFLLWHHLDEGRVLHVHLGELEVGCGRLVDQLVALEEVERGLSLVQVGNAWGGEGSGWRGQMVGDGSLKTWHVRGPERSRLGAGSGEEVQACMAGPNTNSLTQSRYILCSWKRSGWVGRVKGRCWRLGGVACAWSRSVTPAV